VEIDNSRMSLSTMTNKCSLSRTDKQVTTAWQL